MKAYQTLFSALSTLKASRQQLEHQGKILPDCWIAESKPGGTARNGQPHYQLRSRKAVFNGKKSKYLRSTEVEAYQAAIRRGRQLKKLDKQIASLEQRLNQLDQIATRICAADLKSGA